MAEPPADPLPRRARDFSSTGRWAAAGAGLGVVLLLTYLFVRPAPLPLIEEGKSKGLAPRYSAPEIILAPEAARPETDPDLKILTHLQNAFQKIAKRVQPSVVSLGVATPSDEIREELPRTGENLVPPPLDRTLTGSGVILDSEGAILTNEHVVRGAKVVRVTLHDGTAYKAVVAAADKRSDLAVLKPQHEGPATPLVPVVMADSDQVAVGQYAIAVGNPFDLSNTMTVGVVSARGRTLPSGSFAASGVIYGDLIQTDAAINPGNSGGPLFNMRGELIGINTMIFSKTGKFEGFGFAIPSNHVKLRLAYLLKGKPVEYGWLGVVLNNLEPDNTAFKDRGVLVERVVPDSPADRAGLEQGCIILGFDGAVVTNTSELVLAVGNAPAGKVSKIKLRNRHGDIVELGVRMGLRPFQEEDVVRLSRFEPPGVADPEREKAGELTWRGLRVRELSSVEAQKVGGSLMVVRVKKGSPADRSGLYEGALLDEIKYAEQPAIQSIKTLAQFRRATQEAKGPVYLHSPILGYVSLDAEDAP